MKRWVVAILNSTCTSVDAVLYHPTVIWFVRSLHLPFWWSCALARLSGRLDTRWRAGYWAETVPPYGRCDICNIRPITSLLGDRTPVWEPIAVCGWCTTVGDWSDQDRTLDLARTEARRWPGWTGKRRTRDLDSSIQRDGQTVRRPSDEGT